MSVMEEGGVWGKYPYVRVLEHEAQQIVLRES